MSMKPDCFFNVNVCPFYYVYGCEVQREQESRGMFGFHLYNQCPDCKVEFAGWQLWGENGHMQGSVTRFGESEPTRARLAGTLKYIAGRFIHLKRENKWQGTRFHVGQAIYYVGNCA